MNSPLKKLDQSVFDGLPFEYKFAAVDANGFAWAYEERPDMISFDGMRRFISRSFDATDWRNSLIERKEIAAAQKPQPLRLGDLVGSLEPIGPLVEEETGELIFTGWWSDDEKIDQPEPWEVFSLQLFGREAGDWIEGWETIKERLRDRGVKLVWTETGKDVA